MFVPFMNFLPGLFAGKARASPGEKFPNAPLLGRLPALPTNIRLGLKSFPGTNS